jgi:hypothetical protein
MAMIFFMMEISSLMSIGHQPVSYVRAAFGSCGWR